jgi:hypothetical protein
LGEIQTERGIKVDHTKRSLIRLAVSLMVLSGVGLAQDNKPSQAAIVASFKQNIQEVLKVENSKRGPEHAELVSRNIEIPPPPIPPVIVPITGKGIMAGAVNKDGSPCKTWHSGRCFQGFRDSSGTLYVNGKSNPCNPEKHPDDCTANGMTAAAKLAAAKAAAKPTINVVWRKRYTATVSEFGFDVRLTDSLVTPYTGVFSYSEEIWLTPEHATKEDAAHDYNFALFSSPSMTETYGLQEGKWVLLDTKAK